MSILQKSKHFNPGTVVLEPRGSTLAYRGLWLENTQVARLADPIPDDSGTEDWKRFAHEKKSLKAEDFGTFILLEFGFPPLTVPGGRGFWSVFGIRINL